MHPYFLLKVDTQAEEAAKSSLDNYLRELSKEKMVIKLLERNNVKTRSFFSKLCGPLKMGN